MIYVDVNNLKPINDTLGHEAGDSAIRWVAEFIERTVRRCDICCRIGGDEFVIILPGTDLEGRLRAIARLRKQLALERRRLAMDIGVSFGGATYPNNGQDVKALLGHADKAMYKDKQQQKEGGTAEVFYLNKRVA
jgi:diguanylate cyclase (GGDEF)-like protein